MGMTKILEEHSKSLMGVAIAAAMAGISVLVPGALDTIFAGLNSLFRLNLDLNVPSRIGWTLLVVGLVIGGALFYHAHVASSVRKAGKILAVTHTSFSTPCPLLGEMELGKDGDVVSAQRCDLSAFFGDHVDVAAALQQQNVMVADIRAAQRAGDTAIAYGGIVHIPLQFHLGSALATGSKIRLFEKNRNTNEWSELTASAESLGVRTEWVDHEGATSAVIRVSVSYTIEEASVRQGLEDGSYMEAHISIAQPRIDAVSAYSQIDEISREFRGVIDRVRDALSPTAVVHLFYAGPVSLGVSLGRQISHSIHNSTLVYNYQRQANPPYGWAVLVNNAASTVRVFGGRNV